MEDILKVFDKAFENENLSTEATEKIFIKTLNSFLKYLKDYVDFPYNVRVYNNSNLIKKFNMNLNSIPFKINPSFRKYQIILKSKYDDFETLVVAKDKLSDLYGGFMNVLKKYLEDENFINKACFIEFKEGDEEPINDDGSYKQFHIDYKES